ncbi:MAG: anaerobic ribonucleoside-triphosphate reductase [Candidatus Thermoplasmatota archaeon]|nr:anaerobic ribonucleoside-triphosphate reductase [Candidatus Thermoplasmatota archaeon]
MIRKIKKRDGKIDDFNPFRITNAIWKAAQAVGGKDHHRATELTEKVLDNIEKELRLGEIPTVEHVQDTVEKVLIEEGHAKTAKAYILYRHQHEDIREIGGLLKDIDVVDGYLSMMDWKVNENSNMSYSLQGLNVYATENIISHYWLNKIYPPEIGEAHSKGDFHVHDLGTLGAYTYYGRETVIAKINGDVQVISFQDLYEKLNLYEKLLSKKDDAYAKYPDEVQVLDKNGWTNVTRVVKKAKNKSMHFIKNEGGRSVIVTEDHPMVLGSEMFKPAQRINEDTDKLLTVDVNNLLKNESLFHKKEIKISEELLRNHVTDFWVEGLPYEEFLKYNADIPDNAIISTSNNAHDLSNTLTLTEDLGYFVGFYIAEGWMEPHRVSIKQKDTVEKKQIIDRLKQAAYEFGCRPYLKTEDGHITLQIANSSFTNYVMDTIFDIKGISKEKRLPANVLQYNKEFVQGVIAGIIDGDGSVTTSQTSIVLRTASRTLLEQMSVVLNLVGFTVRDRNLEGVGSTRTYNGRLITQHYPLYGMSFRTLQHSIPSVKYQSATISTKAWRAEGPGWHKVLNNQQTEIPDDYIYDITTESHTLVVNGMWNHNCVGWDLQDILMKGFKGVSGKIESKPAKHFGTALMQIVNYLYTLQGEAAGAQALSNFDTLLAPFIRHDDINYKQVKQEMQKFMYNMNVPTRVGFQSPFSNITLDLTVPSYMKDEPVLIGGQPQETTYKEYSEEMDMINQTFAEIMIEGDAHGRPFTFPIPTYNITADFDWEDEKLDSLWEMTAKYGIPYFSNFINSDMSPEDARSMCLHPDEEVLVKNTGNIKRKGVREIVEQYKKGGYNGEGWVDCDQSKNLQMMSLNPDTFKVEWAPIKRFLKVKDDKLVEISTEDGKFAKFSRGHIVPVITEEGMMHKRAEDLNEGDYLLNLKTGKDSLSKEYQYIDDFVLNEDLAKLLGFFTADGNYLFESRKHIESYGRPRGLQFTFKYGDMETIGKIKTLLHRVFNCKYSEKKDPRYNTYYIYVYNTRIARKLYDAGFKKYGRLPQILFNSPMPVIEKFLEFHFIGDGYEKRKEIHMNDLDLSRDLVILYSLIGKPVVYRLRKKSQVIYLQHAKSKVKSNGWINTPILSNRVPGFLAKSTYVVPGLKKSRTVGHATLEKYNAKTVMSTIIEKSDIYIARITSMVKKTLQKPQDFFDVELEKNHLFIHSLGMVTHNCCRLRLDNRELRKRGGGLFGANPKTGSIGVVTINLPRIGYLAKDETDFFNRLDTIMDLAKESLIIKREVIENLTETGLHPYSRFYLRDIKKAYGQFWKNHFSTMGVIGMNDALLNFMGKSIGDPEGEAFAEKVMEHMRDKIADYQEETGNIFNLEATPAEGSLAPDEKVLVSQSDPRFSEIGPLIDHHLDENKDDIHMVGSSEVLKIPHGTMFTYGFSRKTQKIKKYPVTALVRHPAKSMYEITTSSGRRVKVTGQHSVFTINSDGVPEEILVRDIKPDVSIAIPRKIEMETVHTELNLIELFKNSSIKKYLYGVFPSAFIEKIIDMSDVRDWCNQNYKFDWNNVKYMWRKKGVIPIKLLYDFDVKINKNILKSSKIFYRHTKNTAPIKALIPINERLGYILGSLLSEGWLSDRSEFCNTDKKFAKQFINAVENIFGKGSAHFSSTTRKKPRKPLYTVTLSRSIGLFFKEIGLQGSSNEKKIPNFIFHSSNECAAGLLKGYYLGDGYFYENKDNNDYSVRLYTNSKELSEGLNLLLLRFGILTKIKEDNKSDYNPKWKKNYIIYISGAANLETYFQIVLKNKTNFGKVHSGREIIPIVPKILEQIMQKYSVKPRDVHVSKDSFNKNIRKGRISRQFLQEIIQKLSEYILQYDERLEKLKILVDSDIYWDKVKEVKEITPPKHVYDFEVDIKGDQVNNFVGGSGLVCLHNTSYRLARVDKKEYPDIRVYNQENYRKNDGKDVAPYYTNSTQLPVGFTTDVFEALGLQDSLQTKYTGGTVLHIFLGEDGPDSTAVKNLVRKVAENYELPYYTITPTFSICPEHGYIAGEHELCPRCGDEGKTTACEVYSRVVGYLRPVNQWNKGKQQEFVDRKAFVPFDKKQVVKVSA